jgi:glycosylphosphatidylinositol transamidase
MGLLKSMSYSNSPGPTLTLILRRSEYLQETFSGIGLNTGNTSLSTYAHIQPPRSAGTETIILSANWVSRDGGPSLRGVATALALGDFLKGHSHLITGS